MTNDRALPHGDDAAQRQDYWSFVIEREAGGSCGASRGHCSNQPFAGLFIWQLVGVLDTYGSICLIGTKV